MGYRTVLQEWQNLIGSKVIRFIEEADGTTNIYVNGTDVPYSEGTLIGAGGGGFVPVPFSTTLAFDGVNKEMIEQAVTGAVAFISSGSAAGTQINVCLVANGVNTPTFASNFSQVTGSSGYNNTAGVKNYYQLIYTNGKVLYAIFQEQGAPVSPTVPSQVTGLTLGTATSTTQPLTWTAPSNGGSAITDYLVEYKASASGTWLTFTHVASTATSITVTGLTASTSYDYRVSAINAVGTGLASATSTGSTAAAAATTTTWNPALNPTEFTYSNGNLTANKTGTTDFLNTKSIAGKSSGKFYVEFVPIGYEPNAAIGLAPTTGGAQAISYFGGGVVHRNGVTVLNISGFNSASIPCMAVDATAKLVWFRNNAGIWNGNASNDPATGVGGIDFSAMAAPVHIQMYSQFATVPFGFTMRPSTASWTHPAPSGFGEWTA